MGCQLVWIYLPVATINYIINTHSISLFVLSGEPEVWRGQVRVPVLSERDMLRRGRLLTPGVRCALRSPGGPRLLLSSVSLLSGSL